MIVAMNMFGLIGSKDGLPWKIKDEMKFFKEMTMDSIVIMGSKTYESIGKPLRGRVNIVITRKKYENVICVDSIDSALEICSEYDKEVFVIGGKQIYETFLKENKIDRAYVSYVYGEHCGDVYLNGVENYFTKKFHHKQFLEFEVKVYER